ncbi:nicotinamide N-methyltransferase-like [Ylistrum balloti]|uniref:nicotinamide N-methyltransferase-like n=1 Tax=Ylistrum balloti TaxID=509963 RepID=UPI002905E278|nr:nicotinamide N-methyltransferase-like [Ylistrum balloti]
MSNTDHTNDYEGKFDGEWYLNTYYEPTLEILEEDVYLRFTLDSLHDAFRTVKLTGGRLLDVGTGPTLHSVISASQHVEEIFLSDYTDQNRIMLTDWWKSGARTQTGIMAYVLRKEQSIQTISTRLNDMRQKVQGILPVDVHLEQPLGTEYGSEYFDIVISSLCLEVASTSLDEYKKATGNVCSLIKPGGYFVLVGLCGQSFYKVGDSTFSSLPMELREVEDTLEILGNTLLSIRWIKTEYSELSDTKGAFVIVAQKSKS